MVAIFGTVGIIRDWVALGFVHCVHIYIVSRVHIYSESSVHYLGCILYGVGKLLKCII